MGAVKNIFGIHGTLWFLGAVVFIGGGLGIILGELFLARYPVIRIENPSVMVGDVPLGETIVHSFTIYNAGKAPLLIAGQRTSCKCTKATLTSNRIEPRDSTNLQVTVKSSLVEGSFEEYATMLTNDPANKEVMVKISGNSERVLIAEPFAIRFDQVSEDNLPVTGRASISLGKLGNSETMASMGIASSAQYLLCNKLQNGERVEVTLTPDCPRGMLREEALLHVSTPFQCVVKVPVYAYVQGDFTITPTTVLFDCENASDSKTRTCQIKDIAPDRILRAYFNEPELNSYFQVGIAKENGVPEVRVTLTKDQVHVGNRSAVVLDIAGRGSDASAIKVLIPLIVATRSPD